MANLQSHIQQWKHNRSFLSTIAPEYSDWIVTVCFYVALHAVDALLSHDNSAVTDHGQRNEILIRTNRYLELKRRYLPLYNLSRTVRYLAAPATWVPRADIEKRVIAGYLYPIEKSVQNLIGSDLQLPKIVLIAPVAPTVEIAAPPAS